MTDEKTEKSGFDLNRFDSAKYKRRTGDVPITSESLTPLFKEGAKKVFIVQNLTGAEIAQCQEAPKTGEKLRAAIEAIETYTKKEDLQEGMSEFLLGDKDLKESLVISIAMVSLGTISPDLDHQQAVKLHRVAPVDARKIRDKILSLSGKGFLLGE